MTLHPRPFRHLWWITLLMVAALAAAPPGASASGSDARHWTGPMLLSPDTAGVPTSVSCVSATACRAVDSQGNATTYDGSAWSPVHDVAGHYGSLAAVSCPTSTFCAAVGGRRAATRTAGGWRPLHVLPLLRVFAVSCSSPRFCLALSETGRAIRFGAHGWAARPEPAPAHARALSCVSRHFCLALTETGTAYRYDGKVWRRAGDAPAGVSSASVSCVSDSFCMAAAGTGLIGRYHGDGRWTMRRVGLGFVPDAVSCSSTSFCVAVATPGGIASRYDGTWHEPVAFHDYGEGATPLIPDSVSCPVDGRCLVVDELGLAFALRHGWHDAVAYPPGGNPSPDVSCPSAQFCMALVSPGRTETYDGSHWTRETATGGLTGQVSCPTTDFCATTDREGTAYTWDGTAWSTGVTIDDGSRVWASIDCASPDYCLAIGAGGFDADGADVWDGSTWTPVTAPAGPTTDVQCTADATCSAVDLHGDLRAFDGSSWAAPFHVMDTTELSDLSGLRLDCPSTDFCVAWNGVGTVRYLHGTTWSELEPLSAAADRSCGSSTSCTMVVARHPGSVRRYDGSTWGAALRFTPRGYSAGVTAISCPTAHTCVVVDDQGHAFVRHP